MRIRSLCLLTAALLSLAGTGCTGPLREIQGTLVEARTGRPVPRQPLVLLRPPGNYPNIAILVLGEIDPGPIARTRTDAQGHFRILTLKGRSRRLTLALDEMPAGTTRQQVTTYEVKALTDSKNPPGTDFEHEHFYDRQHRPDYYYGH